MLRVNQNQNRNQNHGIVGRRDGGNWQRDSLTLLLPKMLFKRPARFLYFPPINVPFACMLILLKVPMPPYGDCVELLDSILDRSSKGMSVGGWKPD